MTAPQKFKKTAVYALTMKGAKLAQKLSGKLEADCFVLNRYAADSDFPFASLSELLGKNFTEYGSHVFIAASGIVVRTIAPYLKSKAEDPAVVVLDQEGRFAISLLSGHLGGANELARLIADRIGATPVITTATDCAGVPSVDLIARKCNLAIGDIGLIKHINAALLDGDVVPIYDPGGYWDYEDDGRFFQRVDDITVLYDQRCGICVDWKIQSLPERVLALYPRCLALGVGCRRGVSAEDILSLIDAVLSDNDIAREAIKSIGSIDIKSDEQGLLEVADIMGLDLHFFSAVELDEFELANPSGMVMKHIGVGGVCEAAAMKLAGVKEVLVPKAKNSMVTVALAKEGSK